VASLEHKHGCYDEVDCQPGVSRAYAGTNFFGEGMDRQFGYAYPLPGIAVSSFPDPESSSSATGIGRSYGESWIAGPGTR